MMTSPSQVVQLYNPTLGFDRLPGEGRTCNRMVEVKVVWKNQLKPVFDFIAIVETVLLSQRSFRVVPRIALIATLSPAASDVVLITIYTRGTQGVPL